MTTDNGYLRSPATTCFLCPPVFRAIATSHGCYDLGLVLFLFTSVNTSFGFSLFSVGILTDSQKVPQRTRV